MPAMMTGLAETGLTTAKFVRRRLSDGHWWSTAGTPAFEAYSAGSIANYGIAATETGSTGVYTATDPAETTPGDYLLVKAAGASLAVSDVANGVRWQDSAGPVSASVTLGANSITASVLDADAVTEIQSGLATAGELNNVSNDVADLISTVAALNNLSSAQAQTAAAAALTAYDPPTNAEMEARTLAAASYATAAGVAALPTVSQIWTTALTEAYRATGAAGTAAQLLHEIIAHLGDSSIVGTTKTINNRAGSAAKTYTLNSATLPTAIAEAS